jgi:hypothetical protein
MGARNRVGKGLSYRPAGLHRLAESIPWNLSLGSLKVLTKFVTQDGGIIRIPYIIHISCFTVVDKF